MFWTAMAKVKSDADMSSALVIGGRNRPRHCRMPMARLIITEAAIRIGTVFARVAPAAPAPAPAAVTAVMANGSS